MYRLRLNHVYHRIINQKLLFIHTWLWYSLRDVNVVLIHTHPHTHTPTHPTPTHQKHHHNAFNEYAVNVVLPLPDSPCKTKLPTLFFHYQVLLASYKKGHEYKCAFWMDQNPHFFQGNHTKQIPLSFLYCYFHLVEKNIMVNSFERRKHIL